MELNRIERILAAAVLGSDLSPHEIRDFCDRLRFEPGLAERLVKLLGNVAMTLDDLSLSKPAYRSESEDPRIGMIDEILGMLKRSKVSRERALKILSRESGGWRADPKLTLRRNVRDLVEILPSSEAHQFQGRVARALGLPEDPYLRGLTR